VCYIPFSKVDKKDGLIFGALHLKAKEDLKSQLLRKYEMKSLSIFLNNLCRKYKHVFPAFLESKVIIAGDLNFHNLCETSFLYENGFRDTWHEIHKDKIGYTWDP
jgi:hypothetical protein